MDIGQAKILVTDYLCSKIVVSYCAEMPKDLSFYDFNSDTDMLFNFTLLGRDVIGGAEYLAVNRVSGEVRYLGFHGE